MYEYMKPDSKKWDIFLAKKDHVKNLEDFISILNQYDGYTLNNSNFGPLKTTFSEMSKSESDEFFSTTFPFIASIASEFYSIFEEPVKPLKKQKNEEVTLSKLQCACILANAFLCTFSDIRPSSMCSINFITLYRGDGKKPYGSKVAKLKMILYYFSRLAKYQSNPEERITFKREVVLDFPDWSKCKETLTTVVAHTEGRIEDEGKDSIQIDFANKFIGGGVLNYGCVQEEIRFCISPECLVSRYLCESLSDNESLLIIGTERYSKYSGYASSTQFSGPYEDSSEIDEKYRRKSVISAIDAIHFYKPDIQFQPKLIYREINKAYVGFLCRDDCNYIKQMDIATGNWGCGAFKGDKSLKFFIQLVAATLSKRKLVYYTFGDEQLANNINEINAFLQKQNAKVCDIVRALLTFKTRHQQKNGPKNVFEHIKSWLQ